MTIEGAGRRVPAESLRQFAAAVYEKVGVPPADAALFADTLVWANLRGVDSHGIMRLPVYTKRIRLGILRPVTSVSVVADGPAIALLDGGAGVGQVVSAQGMRLAIAKARAAGVGAVGARNSNHFGAAGYYAAMAPPEGMIGFATTNANPILPPPGGAARVVGNNPYAYPVASVSH